MDRLGVLAILLLALLAGCGGDDEGGVAGTVRSAELTRAEWVERVDRLCEENGQATVRAGNEIAEERSGESETEIIAAVLDEIVPNGREVLAEIEDLPAPEDLRSDASAWLGQMEDGHDLLSDLADDARDRGQPDQETVRRLQELDRRTGRFVEETGIVHCTLVPPDE